MTGRSRLALAAALALIASLQVELTARHWTRPFLDGALHYDYDNADFSRRARDGIQGGEARTQLGVTELTYERWGRPTGEPRFYTHHPFLLKAGFQLAVRGLGDAEWVSRVYALAVAIAVMAGVLVALWLATGSVLPAALGALVLVNTPVFALYQSCIKYELDGMATGTWLFVVVVLALGRGGGWRRAAGVAAAVAALTHWTALIFAGVLCIWLGWRRVARGHREAGEVGAAVATGAAAGFVLVLGAFAWLAGGPGAFVRDLGAAARLRVDVSDLAAGVWLERQWLHVRMNFGAPLLVAAGVAGVYVAIAARNGALADPGGERSGSLLGAFTFGTLAAALAWQLGFPQGSFVHVYWQLWFVLPLAGLAAAVVELARGRVARAIAVAAVLAVVVHLHLASRDALSATLALQRGTPADVAFLASQRDEPFRRFVFVPIHDVPSNGWFTGPVFPYYTAREVVPLASAGRIEPGDRLLLLRHDDQRFLLGRLAEYLQVSLGEERCGPTFCAYDVAR